MCMCICAEDQRFIQRSLLILARARYTIKPINSALQTAHVLSIDGNRIRGEWCLEAPKHMGETMET
jgi:hypothetical protein